jgi:hypothetical protein
MVESGCVEASISQIPLLIRPLKALDVIAGLEVGPVLKSDTALGVFAHFGDVLLDVLQGRNGTYCES